MTLSEDSCVVVTGGRGFVGRAVVKAVRSAGLRTLSLDVSEVQTGTKGHEQADELVIDITDPEQLREVIVSKRITAIIHLSAVLPTAAQRDPKRATRVNVDGSVQLLEAAREFSVPRILFGSSLSIYGTRAPHEVISETDPAAPEDVYGAGKLYVERAGAAYRDSHHLQFASLRIGRVVGRGARSITSAWRSDIFEFLATSERREITLPYVESERILLVHVEDVAKMMLMLLRASSWQHAIYNAVCESVVVGELKAAVEAINSKINVRLGDSPASGNPRRLDSSRFQREFGLHAPPILERLNQDRG